MNLKTLNDFSDLAAMILKGQTYDAVAAAATIPQALATIQQLFAASISAVASISDIHAQLGDLNDPDSWDISGNPTDFCPASTPQPAKH